MHFPYILPTSTSKFFSYLRPHFIRHMSSHIKSETLNNEVHLLTLNDPVSANSLSLPLMKELLMALESIKSSQNIKALVITGEGKFFSSGHNLQEVIKISDTNSKEIFSTASEIMKELAEFPIPSIAAVNGPAIAGGCQLVAACDLAISAKSAIFSAGGIKLGLFCSTPAVSLVRAIGLRAANELLLTGKCISAARAYELGLVHRVVEDDKLYEASIEFAKEITQHNKNVIQLGRETLHKQIMKELAEFPIPSIAAVNGPAVAGGCQLVAACDLAISAKSAIFSAGGIKLGLFCSTPAVSLVRAIGLRAANELLLTGKCISAARAYELGLVHRVVEDDKLHEASIEFAEEITQHDKNVIQLGRETLHKQVSMPLMEAYAIASNAMIENLQFNETKQGIQSFLNKKK
ncbi:unnamed protein product [Schistosoma turkestanicum]|nr:unnamed protein product [Schistosoma turkestanicum]